MKYLGLVLCINLMVIAYVWQNIEVMRLRMQIRDTRLAQLDLMQENDHIRYEIERRRTMKAVESYARDNGLRRWKPGDIEVIVIPEMKGKNK